MSLQPSFHALLLLSDSALPLGSFAFSSGLESFLAHRKLAQTSKSTAAATLAAFNQFLYHSLENLASTALPYALSAYYDPSLETLEDLDNDFDASTPCTVARRASIAQGKALLTIWERALSTSIASSNSSSTLAGETLTAFTNTQKHSRPNALGLQLNAHFAPLFGLVCLALGLGVEAMCYLFLLNHAKALLSAAVRASVMGPYQSQAVLASEGLQEQIRALIDRYRGMRAGDAAVSVPVMDLWMGRHELLYSRIFNS